MFSNMKDFYLHKRIPKQMKENREIDNLLNIKIEFKEHPTNLRYEFLEHLEPSTFNLFNFKDLFFKTDKKSEAMTWLWENFDSSGWSFWILRYNK